MIIAYCDRCGDVIFPEVAAGVRYTIGKKEMSGHLCEAHQQELHGVLASFHSKHSLRQVK